MALIPPIILLMWISIFYKSIYAFISCKTDEYFDIKKLSCQLCPQNKTSFNQFMCLCKEGFIKSTSNGLEICQKCPKGFEVSTDGLDCVKCIEQITSGGDKKCSSCENNSVKIDQYFNGTRFTKTECVKCNDNLIPDEKSQKCVPCHKSFYVTSNGKCSCPNSTNVIASNICAKKSNFAKIPDWKTTYKIKYKNGYYFSNFFNEHYRKSAYTCSYLKERLACELLANLCVLRHYAFDGELNACSYYRATFGETVENIPDYVPQIYYDKNFPNSTSDNLFRSIFNSNNEFEIRKGFNFEIVGIRYSKEGSIISFNTIDQIFSFCPELFKSEKSFVYGYTFLSQCYLPLNVILKDYETSLFELFFRDVSNKTSMLIPLPILNENFIYDNKRVNEYKDKRKWQFSKRFFLIDNFSSKSEKSGPPSVIRYADDVELVFNIELDEDKGFHYPPYMRIHYKELIQNEIDYEKYLKITYKIGYKIEIENAVKIVAILVGVSCSLAGILALIKAWGIFKRNGSFGVDLIVIFRFAFLFFGYASNCLFFVLFIFSTFWLIIFKFQNVLWTYLPSAQQEYFIKVFLIIAFSLKIVHILYILYNQITIDIFLIDWEQPKIFNSNPPVKKHKKSSSSKYASKDLANSVSIWRTYFIANEWNELQLCRKVNVPFLLFCMIFYLKVLDYEIMSHLSSSSDKSADSASYSFLSRFVLSISFFLSGAFVQTSFRVVLYERYFENKLQMFVDLCSLANVSVLIFKHRLYGYYIHGRSVYGEADIDMFSLYSQLKKEEEDLCQGRGLEPSSECQTFEIRITEKLREKYDSFLKKLNLLDRPTYRNRNVKENQDEARFKAHSKIKNFLNIFLQHGFKEMDYIVKEKLLFENALDVEFQEPGDISVFYRDNSHKFDRVLAYGEEAAFLTFEMMTFSFVDLFATDFILASVITYVLHRIINWIRFYGSKRNLINKTLVDGRFLI